MSEDILNMSLDDIIKTKPAGSADKTSRKFKRKGDAPGGGRNSDLRLRVTTATAQKGRRGGRQQAPQDSRLWEAPRNQNALDGNAAWEHDLFDEGPKQRLRHVRPATRGFKLLVTNLDYKVSDDDIRELFENCGTVIKAGVIYDRSGRSEEAAEVVFQRREDALAALKRYNHLALDNKPMNIELIENSQAGPSERRTLSSGIRIGNSKGKGPSAVQQGTKPSRIFGIPASHLRINGPARKARGRGSAISHVDLDKDLDSYMADS